MINFQDYKTGEKVLMTTCIIIIILFAIPVTSSIWYQIKYEVNQFNSPLWDLVPFMIPLCVIIGAIASYILYREK